MSVISFSIENRVGVLTISRPEALNALNSEVLSELEAKLNDISKLSFSELRCLIITGAGEKAFVAGADIKEISQLNERAAVGFAHHGQKVFRTIEKLHIPVIAAVNGFALGGGLELALSCDFIYASENSKLGLPEVGLGLLPGFGGTVRLSRVVGKARAKEMILSGLPLSSSDALSAGLVNKVLPLPELMKEVRRLAEVIATRGPKALDAAKKSIDTTFETDLDTGMTEEAKFFSGLFATSDMKEGTLAFIEKRKADFQGK